MEKKKIKKLSLKASQRDNRRYFLADASREEVHQAVLEYLGVLGLSESAYMSITLRDGKIAHSCRAAMLDKVRASLAFKGREITLVSGTVKGLEESRRKP